MAEISILMSHILSNCVWLKWFRIKSGREGRGGQKKRMTQHKKIKPKVKFSFIFFLFFFCEGLGGGKEEVSNHQRRFHGFIYRLFSPIVVFDGTRLPTTGKERNQINSKCPEFRNSRIGKKKKKKKDFLFFFFFQKPNQVVTLKKAKKKTKKKAKRKKEWKNLRKTQRVFELSCHGQQGLFVSWGISSLPI